jgi:hypothetical protein
MKRMKILSMGRQCADGSRNRSLPGTVRGKVPRNNVGKNGQPYEQYDIYQLIEQMKWREVHRMNGKDVDGSRNTS